MAHKLSPILLALLSIGLLAVPAAGAAIGVQGNRAVAAAPAPAAAKASAPPGGALIAPAAACPDQEDLTLPAGVQEEAMTCMVDFARRQAGLPGLTGSSTLAQSAQDKAGDVLRCDEFSHFACGREFTYWMQETGYTSAPCWRVGENLAWGTGEYGSVRSTFVAWMRSPTHRANLLGDFEESGISLGVGTLEGLTGTRVWAEHFGTHCG
jgi:uncharacterized protein YkwD